MKLSIPIGTRPQLIKISPLVRRIEKEKDIELQFIDTGQHYDHELNKTFYDELNLPESKFLEIGSGAPGEQTGNALIAIEKELIKFGPDLVLVIGDTNSTLAGALAAVKQKIPLGHIEAGLRSFDRRMPEEINRIIVDHISDYLFTPTKNALKNLKKEGIPKDKIFFTYDITVDACLENYRIAKEKSKILEELDINPRDYVVVTAHRQENVDKKENLEKIVDSLLSLNKEVIFPVHPRTLKNLEKFGLREKIASNCKLVKPAGYFDFLMLLANAACVVTDSGGVQKESLILKTPCITIRESTEWVETVKLDANILVGLNEKKIAYEVEKRSEERFHRSIDRIKNPYGDGKTNRRILDFIKKIIMPWPKGF
ncbi:MAG: UDP-N-acetylglucosamine 2-epimerase [Candidatus Altiarchaeales archaeon WOR_SM1_79]|nr:MAG: UDP-N-acetylglucosamine 2-epimerase [Candidatus Altiarchaeales archaeon WOR_SM1_79]